MRVKLSNSHDDYRRIRMVQNLLFIAINGGPDADPLVRDLQANFVAPKDRADLIAGLKAELWATVKDTLPGTDPFEIYAETPSGSWLLTDLMLINKEQK